MHDEHGYYDPAWDGGPDISDYDRDLMGYWDEADDYDREYDMRAEMDDLDSDWYPDWDEPTGEDIGILVLINERMYDSPDFLPDFDSLCDDIPF